MRNFTYPLDAEDIDKIKTFLLLPLEDLERALNIIEDSPIKTGTTTELSALIDDVLPSVAAFELIAFIRGLRRNMEILNFNKNEVIKAFGNGIADHEDSDVIDAWKNKEKLIARFLDSKPIITSVKIGELLGQHNFHIHKLAITTTVVPVFDDGRSEIAANIIKNVLFLTSSDANEDEQILSYPLGEEDLKNLIRLAENALKKTDVIRREVTTVERPTIVYRAHP